MAIGSIGTVVTTPVETENPSSTSTTNPAGSTTENGEVYWEDLSYEDQQKIGQSVVSMVFDPIKEINKGFQ